MAKREGWVEEREILPFEVVGWLGEQQWYRVSISVRAFQTLVNLAREGADVPHWLVLGTSTVRDQRVIITPEPEFFTRQIA